MTKTKPFNRVFAAMSTLIIWVACIGLSGPAMAADDEENVMSGEYSKGTRLCMACHKEGKEKPAHEIFLTSMGISGDSRSPFAEGNHGCESCHGPSKDHTRKAKDGSRPPPAITFAAGEDVETKNQACLSCHDSFPNLFHWPGSVHDVEENACVDCHDLHTASDPVLALETQPEVCYSCHKEERAQFLRQSRHPVKSSSSSPSHEGLMACSDCHQPHGSAGPASLKRNTVNESCYDCHAEKRGPFLWEHAPVQEDCSNCHTPHGSNYENLLVGRQPYLCQQCHLANFHPSGVYSGTGVQPDGADQRMLGKQCLNCHVQIHGSNHPGGLRQTR